MKIGLAAWIIQDGNYGDFSVGDISRFALEFHANSYTASSNANISASNLKDATYKVTAKVVFKKDNLTIIDFGYLAYSEQEIAADAGDWIEAEIYVGIDPFMYFENWARKDGIPEISYNWKIESILLETTPRIEEKPRYFARDKSRFSEIMRGLCSRERVLTEVGEKDEV